MLKSLLDTLDEVDEAVKPHYKQLENGKWGLDTDEAAQMMAKLAKEKATRKSLEAKLDSLSGLDVEEYARLKEEAAKRETEEAEKAKDWDRAKKQIAATHAAEKKALEARLEAVMQERQESFVASEIAREVAAAKGIPDILEPVISRQVKALEQDGRLQLAVLGKDGSPRVKDGAGNPFTVADLVAELKGSETFSVAFQGSGASGSGSRTANAPTVAPQGAAARYEALKAKSEANALTSAEGYELVRLGTQVRAAKTATASA